MDDIRDSAAFAVSQLGWKKLKELQLKVITAFVASQDVFAVIPTGYGKSLCYACLPLLFDHLYQLEDSQRSIVIVVTPLIAIIGKSSLVSLFYAIKEAIIKSAFVALGHLLNQSTDFSNFGDIISTAYTVHSGSYIN